MSITGKNSKSIRKVDVKESKTLAQGFTKLVFAHKASLGDTLINLGSLTTPTEMSALGFTNPSPSRLTEARLFQFKTNLTLISSLRGALMQDLSYRVNSNSSIKLEFEAQDGEIFTGIIDANPVSGIQVIDAKQAVAKGDLADGSTDFAIGFSTKTLDEDIIVIRNGLVQTRNTNNSSTVEDGNYYVVDSGSGYGNLIRFNAAASGSDDSVLVVSLGGIIESPTNSTWDEIQKVQGQIDALVPTVSALAGVPETDFQAAPNDVDLKQFGAIVMGLLDMEVPIYQTETIDLTGVGGFTGGSIVVTRIGNGIILSQGASLTHASNNVVTATEIIPEWALPPLAMQNVHFFAADNIKKINVTSAGTVTIDYRTHAGATFNDTSSAGVTISYNVPGPATQTLREHLENKGIL